MEIVATSMTSGRRPASLGGRLEYLDAVRGLAAMTVVWSHYIVAFGMPSGLAAVATNSPLHIWWDGFAAVSLFFVLSGYVLSLRFLRIDDSDSFREWGLPAYVVRRAFRLWAPYLAILLISACVWRYTAVRTHTLLPASAWIQSFWTSAPGTHGVLRQMMLLRPWDSHELIDRIFPLVPQAWTLSVELSLSLLVPVGVLLARRGSGWLLFFALVAVATSALNRYAIHFALGIVLARNAQAWIARLERRRALHALCLVTGVALYTFRYTLPVYLPRWFAPFPIWQVTAVGSALLLLSIMASPRARQVLGKGVLSFLGRISYSIYLTHFAILICLTPRVLAWYRGTNVSLAWTIGLLATTGLTVSGSAVLYWLVERPSIQWGRDVGRWLARAIDTPHQPASRSAPFHQGPVPVALTAEPS